MTIDHAHALLAAHWPSLMLALALWIALGRILAAKWQIPASGAPWYTRAAHFALVNLPHYGAALQGRTIFGLRVDFPIFSWTLRPDAAARPDDAVARPALPPRDDQKGFIDASAILLIGLIALLGISAFVLSSVLSGCAPTTAYAANLKAESLAANTYVDSYEAWRRADYLHQEQIRAAATSREDGATKLAAWRATRDIVDAKFVVLRYAIKAYAEALSAAGAARQQDFGSTVAAVIAAVSDLAQALKDAGVNVPLPRTSFMLKSGDEGSPPADGALTIGSSLSGEYTYAR